MKSVLVLGLCACTAMTYAAEIPLEKVDPRVRTFVNPTRIVWKSEKGEQYDGRFAISGEDSLLKSKHGQIPEFGWGNGGGLKLVNCGNAPGIILDFGRELHGGLHFGMGAGSGRNLRIRVRFGESVAETCSDALSGLSGAGNDHALRDFEMTLPVMGAIEIGNTGFRFVRIDLLSSGTALFESIRAISLMRPMPQVGAFRSSDERLNRVWETAARTIHLCCQDYLWDGIKRDRLVWMGDTHPETRAILSVFGGASVLPESLDYAIATTAPDKWMNTMPNYTLWFLRNVRDWYGYTGDAAWVKARGPYLKATVEHVLANVRGDAAAYDGGKGSRVFLDWPTEHNRPAVKAGTRGLLAIALDDAATLMDLAGEAALAAKCRATAAQVRTEKPDPAGAKSAAALLALGGLRDAKEMYRDVLGKDGHEKVSTFYGYYMLEAMSAAGENQRALDTVRDYWGGMLDAGATSFWEDFKLSWTNNCFRIDEYPVPGKIDIHGNYGEFCYRGFRHSLCHAWSSGPAAWCINHVLGIEALDAGCAMVRVKPFLGDLSWAEGALPTPKGPVKVRVDKKPDGTLDVKIDAPAGVKIVR